MHSICRKIWMAWPTFYARSLWYKSLNITDISYDIDNVTCSKQDLILAMVYLHVFALWKPVDNNREISSFFNYTAKWSVAELVICF